MIKFILGTLIGLILGVISMQPRFLNQPKAKWSWSVNQTNRQLIIYDEKDILIITNMWNFQGCGCQSIGLDARIRTMLPSTWEGNLIPQINTNQSFQYR